ncbi:MAG: bifunctional glutamate N-acetyltransferase/amino-acid acetyltransferase ArgJ [Polyangiaceae bacterium]
MSSPPPATKIPEGFRFSGIPCGIKATKRDLGLLVSDAPAVAAGTFTRSSARAASVRWCEAHLPTHAARAIVVASGNANAMSGAGAAAANERMASAVARALDVTPSAVLTATTGVVGVPFPVERVEAAAGRLVESLGDDVAPFADAILTTDTTTKLASREIHVGGTRVRLLGIAKGSGMVHPNMATVLAFVATDISIDERTLREAIDETTRASFNALSIDGATSTNDSFMVLANGLAENPIVDGSSREAVRIFTRALREIAVELARAVARDGEGARRLITVRLAGAPDEETGRDLARAVVASNLVKAAIFGADAGHGRVLAALGARAAATNVRFLPERVSLWIQGVRVMDRGEPLPFDADALRTRLRQRDVLVEIDLDVGDARAEAWGCDLSYDYVRINADYAAVLVDGPVRRDGRLDTKTPELKTSLVVSALDYIARFAGTRAVVRYGRATLARQDLALTFAEDVRLLTAVGLSPILVQEGSSEIVVTALARRGVRAIGLSGADGNLFALPSNGDANLSVDPDVIETLLEKRYIPIVVPEYSEEASRLLGTHGSTICVETVASEIAVACRAKKLIYLGEAPGLLAEGLLVSELSADELDRRLLEGSIEPGARKRARAAVRALAGGVESVHFIDERTPHVVVAELFTEAGMGTMVTTGPRALDPSEPFRVGRR